MLSRKGDCWRGSTAPKSPSFPKAGTKDSVVAALLSRVAECVTTFDIQRSPLLDDVLAVADARNVAALDISNQQGGWSPTAASHGLTFPLSAATMLPLLASQKRHD